MAAMASCTDDDVAYPLGAAPSSCHVDSVTLEPIGERSARLSLVGCERRSSSELVVSIDGQVLATSQGDDAVIANLPRECDIDVHIVSNGGSERIEVGRLRWQAPERGTRRPHVPGR